MTIGRLSIGKRRKTALSIEPLSVFDSESFGVLKSRSHFLFLLLVILYGAFYPTLTAYAEVTSENDASSQIQGKTSTTPSVGKINDGSAPAPQSQQASQYTSATNAKPLVSSSSNTSSFLNQVADTVSDQSVTPAASPSTSKPTYTPHELTSERTATSSLYLNKDGSITKTTYLTPHFYQTGGRWQPIDMTLQSDDNAADSTNIFGEALGKVESLVSTPNAYKTTANSWEARFTPSDFSGGMVRIEDGSSQVGFSPVNANTVSPVITTAADGEQTVTYSNLWTGVDVTYRVESDEVKESIILKNQSAATQVQFTLIGASLQKLSKPSSPGDTNPAFNIQGALGGNFGIAPVNLSLSHVDRNADSGSGLSQTYSNNTLTVSVSNSYLQQLPSGAFPVVIDPSIGTSGSGSYVSFQDSPSTVCYPNDCDLYAGIIPGITDDYWRGALFSSYNFLNESGITLTDADLHLAGTTFDNQGQPFSGTYSYQVGEATCLTSYSCMDMTWDSGSLTDATGSIDVTNIYQNFVSNNNWGGYLMIGSTDDHSYGSFADFDPNYSYVSYTYTTRLLPPTTIAPQPGMTYTDPQASFSVNTESNPNDSTPLEYQFQVTDGSDGTGAVVNSGGFVNSTDWTVPDGVLQNGTTYYLEAQSYDPSTGYTSAWSTTPVPFRIDMREGSDSTQTYDTVGPAKVDLATGNLETSSASHSTAALGGNLGVSLNYNSPLKSSPGLVGSYWNLSSGGSGIPTTAPNLQRVDQNIDFNWNSSSPGTPINSTYFAAQWNGYFIAPTTGNFTFGGINDDWLNITVNGTNVYNNSSCTSGPCYGSSIYLTSGQVVPFVAQYNQDTGADQTHIYVSGPVTSQVVPEAWFQTGVREIQQHGLVGQYYTYTDTGVPPTFPTDGTDGLFMTRTDPIINFNWSGNVPVTNGPQADWMAQWTGYLTVPATGSYVFGAQSNDGSSITVNGTGVYSHWEDGANTGYGTSVSLTAGQSVPVTVQYYQHTGGSNDMSLLVEPLGGSSEVVPTSWLTPTSPTLPAGWSMDVDSNSTVSYTHLSADTSNVDLTDSSGDTYDYAWNGKGYSPPAGSSGFLNHNADGTWTLQDSSGETYVFSQAGDLSSVTNPTDSTLGDASLTYSYGKVNGSGPDSILQITDGVNSNRWAKVYYGGASQCGTPPSGFGTTPTNMLCAVQTNDGRTTYFYYDTNGDLAEVSQPGNSDATYQYQAVENSSDSTIGYQLTGIRSSLANDAVIAGERSNDSSTYAQIQYDALGRVDSVSEPAATAGASQLTKTIDYAQSPYWQTPVDLDDNIASGASPVTVSWGSGRIDMFARGTANQLLHKFWAGTTWSSWESLGGCIEGDPSAASWAPGRLDIFGEGCNGTGANLDHIFFSSGWGSWGVIGSTHISSAPTVTSWGSGRLDIFAKGSSGSDLYHEWYSGGWGSGESLGGCLANAPAATSWGANRLDVFVRECSSSGTSLEQLTYDGSWQPWASDSLTLANLQPTVASLEPGQIDVLTTNSTNNIEQATYTQSGGWTGWNQSSLCASNRPSISLRLDSGSFNQYDLFGQTCGQPWTADIMWQQYTQPLNTTIEHVTGATEPAGYSEKVQYDYEDRTTAVYNNLGQATTTEWDPLQDLQYSTTNPEGLMSTNIYNDENQIVSQYGPAPASDYNTWKSTLANGASMSEGQSIESPDGRYTFTFETNGNLVLSGPGGEIWQSGTTGDTATALTLQNWGNLVEYNNTTPVWADSSAGPGPSATLTVQNDGNLVIYGSSGAYWSTGTDGQMPGAGGESASGYDTPISGDASQVPETTASYDQGATGLSTNYFALNETSGDVATLASAPLLHTTNIASDGTMTHDWSTAPVSGGNWGFSMTGTMRLPSTGNWVFNSSQSGGERMWIDGQLVIDDWHDYSNLDQPLMGDTYTFDNTIANSVHSVRIDYYYLNDYSSIDASYSLSMTPPGGSSTTSVATYFSPSYGLQTSATSDDSTTGNATVNTNYGTDPGIGQVASTTIDPTGLDLTSTDAYQTAGSGYGMLTSQTAPGGATTAYSYYGANDTAVNPCVGGSATAYQAGMLKTVTQPSGETITNVYDDAGNIVATQTNSDGWECRTYDARGRITEDVIPAFNGGASRTITYNYDVGGNPLVTSETDGEGTITTDVDLLGRTVSYTDVYGDTTTMSYDSIGRASGDSGPLGTEGYTYNGYGQLTNQTLNSTNVAQPTYDSYGRLSTITYPTAGVTETIGYDSSHGDVNSDSYTLASSKVISDSDTHSQSGKILTDTTAFGTSSSTWSYTYDLADRLTNASSTGAIGSNSYGYSFGSESGSCPTGTNANAGKDGNRTSETINGTTTSYCYNGSDQLTTSSNAYLDAATYDTHGNTTQFGDSGDQTAFAYDSSDRTASITQGSQSTTYAYDANDDIISRTVNNGSTATTTDYGYTGTGDSFAMNTSDVVKQDYVSLPGGLSLAINPGQTGAASQAASLINLEGDVIDTVDGDEDESGEFSYDPFGNLISTGGQPGNATNSSSFGWAGGAGRITESSLALDPIQMGARIYIPSLGRFASEDPDPGSLPNLYTYPLDPINSSDLSGESLFGSIVSAVKSVAKTVAKTVAHVVAAVASTVVEVIRYAATTVRAATTPAPKTSTSSSAPASKAASIAPSSPSKPNNQPVNNVGAASAPTVENFQGFTNTTGLGGGQPETPEQFPTVGGWSKINQDIVLPVAGAAVGCIVGMAMFGAAGVAGVAIGCAVDGFVGEQFGVHSANTIDNLEQIPALWGDFKH